MSQEQLKFTLLGTGSSGGVPRIGNDWGDCDPDEPKNRRTRCGAMLERSGRSSSEPTRVLIDTSPDIREQLLKARVGRVDAVVYTHEHADQTSGIHDLRVLAIRQRQRIPVYMDAPTADALTHSAAYCFQGAGDYPSILDKQPLLQSGLKVAIDGPAGAIELLPLKQVHGRIDSLGFRVADIAYCNDVNALPPKTLEAIRGVRVLIVDALRYTSHPSHANLEQALSWASEIGASRTILTNMHIDMDYQTLRRELPAGVEPGYDGLTVETRLT